MDVAVKYLLQELDTCDNSTHLLSVLTALTENLETVSELKTAFKDSQILSTFCGIIRRPHKHLQRAKSPCENLDLYTEDETEILSLIRRSAVKCLFQVADCNIVNYGKECVETLLGLFNPVSQDVFRFSSEFSSTVINIIGDSLGSELKAVNVEKIIKLSYITELKIYEPELIKLSPTILTQIPFWLFDLELTGTSAGKDMSSGVADVLVSKRLAWRKNRLKANLSRFKKKGKTGRKDTSANSSDRMGKEVLVVTEVMYGNFFWILMGREVITTVSKIHDTLRQEKLDICPSPLTLKDMVATRVSSPFGNIVIRSQILAIEKSYAVVFGVDIGGLYRVQKKDIFVLPPALDLANTHPQVAIGRLKDIMPAALDLVTVELAAATLSKICRRNISQDIVTHFMELQVLSFLPPLIDCSDGNIAKQILSLATNLLLKGKHICESDWLNIVLVTLDMINQFIIQMDSNKTSQGSPPSDKTDKRSPNKSSTKVLESASKSALQSKATSPEAQSKFSYRHALTVVGLTMMTNFLHMNKCAKDYFYQQNGIETVLRAYLLMKNNFHIRQAAIQLLSNFININTKKQLMDNQLSTCTRQGLNTTAAISAKVIGEGHEEDAVDGIDLKAFSFEEPDIDLSDIIMEDDEPISPKNDKTQIDFYIRDSLYPFTKDPSYELHPDINLKSGFLASVLCGMLNTGHGGTISLGISEDGQVKGVKISHDAREGLRGGIKDIMDFHLQPHLLYPQLEIKLLPVVPANSAKDFIEKGHVYNDLYVAEITCQPLPGIVYSCRNNEAFYRFGYKTGTLNERDIRHLVVIEEEALHREAIQELQTVAKKLRARLDADVRL